MLQEQSKLSLISTQLLKCPLWPSWSNSQETHLTLRKPAGVRWRLKGGQELRRLRIYSPCSPRAGWGMGQAAASAVESVPQCSQTLEEGICALWYGQHGPNTACSSRAASLPFFSWLSPSHTLRIRKHLSRLRCKEDKTWRQKTDGKWWLDSYRNQTQEFSAGQGCTFVFQEGQNQPAAATKLKSFTQL